MRSIILWHQLTIDGAHEPIYQCAAILQLFSSSDLKRRSWRCSKPANHQPPHLDRPTNPRGTTMRNPGRKLAALALLGVATYGLGIYAATARAAPPPIHEGHGELVTITTQRQVKALIVKTWPRWARSQALRVAWRESRLMPDPPHNNAARGVYQFIPSTWNGSWNPWRHTSPTDARANIMAAHRLWQRSGGSFYPHWAATARRASSAVGVTASIGAHGPPGLDQAIRSVTKQMPPNTIMASSCVADSTAGPWDCTLDLYPTGSTVIASTYHLDVWRLATCPHGWSRCWKWHWTQVLDA